MQMHKHHSNHEDNATTSGSSAENILHYHYVSTHGPVWCKEGSFRGRVMEHSEGMLDQKSTMTGALVVLVCVLLRLL